ncbi:alcohol oxidase [Mycena albidolilacea]|uniref:Alcohol oxidase n=1 Tax=Mycena albidolilacea TaxID=1033008 RepID=A0AAD7A6X2_9AGAR|nr:alcohol oxidase [Mycena albidolilacea]
MGIFGSPAYPVLSIKQAGSPFEESAKQAIETKTYDYVIVGGGTAGCCLASRLSEDPSVSVLVLERGPVHDAWFSRIPMVSSNLYDKATPVVRSPSMPVAGAQGKIVDVIHTEALGGASCVNQMLVTRGPPGDFDHWAALGHPSWDYKTMQPYFLKSEKSLSQTHSTWRGHSGPLVNKTSTLLFDIHRNVRTAASALGFTDTSDFNAPDVPVDVCAILDEAIDDSLRRVSSYNTFLPAELAYDRHQRLKICTKAVATRIEFEDGVAVGVVFESSDKSIPGTFYARARKEIVVCSGAIGSPQLLLLSGIGPKEHLEEHGIAPLVDLPGVGAHLQDHIGIPLMYEIPLWDSVHHAAGSAWKGVWEFGKYMLGFKSIMGSTISPMSIFAHSTHLDDKTARVLDPVPSLGDRPDLEIMTIAYGTSDAPVPPGMGIFSFLLCNMQPKSLGSVRLASSDPHARPDVDLAFLSNAEDYAPLRRGIQLTRRLAAQVAAQGYPIKDFQLPASDADADLDAFVRAQFRTCYHYSASCRMARREEGGVVDDELRVYGVSGLRVCDASVFPCIPSAHTMVPVIMFAERCADLVKAAAKTY